MLLLIVLIVIFTMSMFVWLMANLGAGPVPPQREGIVAWIAVLVLGVAVFLMASGVLAWRP